MRSILIHVKNNEVLKQYMDCQDDNYSTCKSGSKELYYMILAFLKENFNVYLTTIFNFSLKDKSWNGIYHLNSKEYLNMDIKKVNSKIDIMIIRNIGSVEKNFNIIKNYLIFISKHYKGYVLNNPKSMLKGMTKRYLKEIDEEELKKIGIIKIPSYLYSKKVHFSKLKKKFKDIDNYLIKPITGELSNSLSVLKDIDENFLRYKESKVGGWVIEPIKKEIYNGEYQLVFLRDKLIYSQKKEYLRNGNVLPSQKDRILCKYKPNDKEVNTMLKLISYFKKLYKIDIDICRIDYMKDANDIPILLEFEMVNPGFFIGYMKEDDKDIDYIISNIVNYCKNIID